MSRVARPKPKPSSYYDQSRPDLVESLPRPLGRVLDLGCGSGEVGRRLRQQGATRLVGVEINEQAAALAKRHYDRVVVGSAETVLEELRETFETICCFDVLEHLIDPYRVLCQLRDLAAEGGILSVSVPNARHWSLVRDLVFRGTFGYTSFGHRDDTHLRWFSPRDIEEQIANSGWKVSATSYPHVGRSYFVTRLTRSRFSQFLAVQWYVLAYAAPRDLT